MPRLDLTSLINASVSDLRHELHHETDLIRKDMKMLSSGMIAAPQFLLSDCSGVQSARDS